MHCSVVIPCWNGAALTRACILSLLQQVPEPPAEILVVDNASTDETPHLGDMHPSVRVLRQPRNLGFAGGVNVGLRAATGDTVLVLNNDTQAAPDLLLELHRQLRANPGVGAVAPVSNHVKGRARIDVGDAGRTMAARIALSAELAQGPAFQDVDTLAGLCLLAQRTTFAAIGGFDERFGHGNFEDDDWCLRARLHGLRLGIARRAFLHHEGHATFQALGLDLRHELDKRRAQFEAKWRHDPAGLAHLAAWRGDLASAADAARVARSRWPMWLDADWHLARWHLANGEPATAAAHLKAVLRACPHHVEARLALGQCQLDLGDTMAGQATLATAERGPLDDGQRRTLHLILGNHAFRRGAFAEARQHYAATLAQFPDDGDAHNGIGLCLLGTGDATAARPHFVRATTHGCAPAHTNLGICQVKSGELDAARSSFARAVELLPHDLQARANLAAVAQFVAT
ncbi:MAG: glycosyltransferase [Planctomycetes bacterium]|nr:glycosyltransferase [Planctomycetota bacterium]